MDLKTIEEELENFRKEFEPVKSNYNKLLKKEELLHKLYFSARDYNHGLNSNFEDPSNSLTHFLKSDLVTLDPKKYCRQKIFVAVFNDYCKENHFPSSKWTSEFYAGSFADFGINIVNNKRKRYPDKEGAKSYTETFIIGVDLKENYEYTDSDSD